MKEVVRKRKKVNYAEEKIERLCYYFFAFTGVYLTVNILEYLFRNLIIDIREKIFTSHNFAILQSMLSLFAYVVLAFVVAFFIFICIDIKKREARNARKQMRRKRSKHNELVEKQKQEYKKNNFFHIQMIRPEKGEC